MPNPRSNAFLIAPVLLLAVVSLVACSSSSNKNKTSNSAPASTASQSSSSSAANGGSAEDVAAITAAYTTFFNSKTPQTESVKLLQNGEAFKQTIAEQAKSPLSQGSSVTVSKVTVLSGGKATVTFSILINGAPTLTNQGGWAVKEDGTWKVAGTTFCGLVSMEGKTPAVCMDAKSTTLPG